MEKEYSAEEIVGVTGCCEMIIGMRLHSLIYAATQNVPTLNISYDPKVSGFVDYLGTSTALDINGLTKEKLIAEADEIIKNYDAIKENIAIKMKDFKEKTEHTSDIAIGLINKD